MTEMTRKDFLAGALGLCAAGRAIGETSAVPDGRKASVDPGLAVLISDLHIPQPRSEQKYKTGMEYPWIVDQVKRFVGELLSMRPRPAHVFCLGDVSVAFSEERDYEIAAALLRPLEDAGIQLVMTVGNHDLRAPFLRHLGRWCGTSPVPGRITSVTHLPDFDFILLDSLREPSPTERGKYNALLGCGLGEAQKKWLAETLAAATRPVILAAHHSARHLGMIAQVVQSPQVFGFIHGHNHRWDQEYLFNGYSRTTLVRCQGVASFGIDGDVGYALLRSSSDAAELRYVARDYYFPLPVPKDARPPLWDDIVRDNSSRVVSFPFKK